MAINKIDKAILWEGREWVNRGGSLLEEDPLLAKRFIAKGIEGIPNEPIAWFNLGIALHQQYRIHSAIRAYQYSLTLANCPQKEILQNLSHDLLLIGRFEEGWKCYENRLSQPKHDNSYFINALGPAWQGFNDPRPCKQLILVSEQGFGDTLQFIRLAIQLKEKGLNITIFCQKALARLLKEGSNLTTVLHEIKPDRLTKGTLWCPLLSLPNRLNLTKKSIQKAQGYLTVKDAKVKEWKQKLKRKKGHLLVAIHWQGNLKHERSLYCKGRSMSFHNLLPLSGIKNVEFIAIQKGSGLQQIDPNSSFPFVKGQKEFNVTLDFRDTAGVLANCDLLISADSGVVHLAGALGVPTWLALRWIPEWRWGIQTTNTPWYQNMELFRQPSNGDWNSVINRIAERLKEFSTIK
ncbi:glycosyltransferase family 9 protein [Prochlorococcus sp. MIT 1300]|uniref:glycosyltransferase family 9 protein n=1 Tax=Prochlorococcus sp. MIT 1300 TaxID=3096218 RepID=UPI002A747A76|nr:glycosyltransferase family 9 protein [Prochlorococcus sp. MIT 1300]